MFSETYPHSTIRGNTVDDDQTSTQQDNMFSETYPHSTIRGNTVDDDQTSTPTGQRVQ